MSTVKKGMLTKSGEWARHLRKLGRRMFWKRERQAEKKITASRDFVGWSQEIK